MNDISLWSYLVSILSVRRGELLQVVFIHVEGTAEKL